MKTYTNFADLPSTAVYLGSLNGDGSMYEDLADAIDQALNPVRLKEPDGHIAYFELID